MYYITFILLGFFYIHVCLLCISLSVKERALSKDKYGFNVTSNKQLRVRMVNFSVTGMAKSRT